MFYREPYPIYHSFQSMRNVQKGKKWHEKTICGVKLCKTAYKYIMIWKGWYVNEFANILYEIYEETIMRIVYWYNKKFQHKTFLSMLILKAIIRIKTKCYIMRIIRNLLGLSCLICHKAINMKSTWRRQFTFLGKTASKLIEHSIFESLYRLVRKHTTLYSVCTTSFSVILASMAFCSMYKNKSEVISVNC